MTKTQKAELVALVEKGSQANVGYYHSAGAMFEFPEGSGDICAEKWGFALIGKFGDPVVALRKFKELQSALPESNPGCFRMIYAVAQILGIEDWKELVEIHYACDGHSERREDEVKEFQKIVFIANLQQWAQAVLADAFQEYEAKLAESEVTAELEKFLGNLGVDFVD